MALTNAAVVLFGDRSQTDMELHLILRPLSLTLSEGRVGVLLLLVMGPRLLLVPGCREYSVLLQVILSMNSNIVGSCRLLVI